MSTLKLLEAAANNNHGITLQPRQARVLAGFIMDLQARNEWLHNMCAAYMNEYGPELFYALTEDDIVEGEVSDDSEATDAESSHEGIDAYAEGSDNTSGAEGAEAEDAEGEQERPVQEEAGLHPQVAEEPEQPLEIPEGEE